MLTPQEVSERAFTKANFGGYNMAMVDEFLDLLTEDYGALYKENAVLKTKMKVLTDKVEEYRSTEDAMRKALLTAQKMADDMMEEARRKQADMLAEAQQSAQQQMAGVRHEIESEALRLTAAKNSTAVYIAQLRELYQHEQTYLESLSQLTAAEVKTADPVRFTAGEIESTMHLIMEQAKKDSAPAAPSAGPGQAEPFDQPDLAPASPEEPKGGMYDDLKNFSWSPGGMQEQHIDVTLGARASRTPVIDSGEDDEPDEPTQRFGRED